MFVNVPSISRQQWHPFTISSNSSLEPDRLSVIIKSEGTWSRKLYQILSSPSSINRLEASVEGPYGPVSSHFLRYLLRLHAMLVFPFSKLTGETLKLDFYSIYEYPSIYSTGTTSS